MRARAIRWSARDPHFDGLFRPPHAAISHREGGRVPSRTRTPTPTRTRNFRGNGELIEYVYVHVYAKGSISTVSCRRESISRILSRPKPVGIIHLGRRLPVASSDLPEVQRGQRSLTFVLLQVGFAARRRHRRRGCLATPFHRLPPLAPRAVSFLWHFPPITRGRR